MSVYRRDWLIGACAYRSLYSSLLPSVSPTLLPFQIANETKVVVRKEENEATIRQRRHKQLLHADAQRDLDEALPMLDAALALLKSLNKNDVVQVSWCHATVHAHGLKFIIYGQAWGSVLEFMLYSSWDYHKCSSVDTPNRCDCGQQLRQV